MSVLTFDEQLLAVENLVDSQGITGTLELLNALIKVREEQGINIEGLKSYKTTLNNAIMQSQVIDNKLGAPWGKIYPLEV